MFLTFVAILGVSYLIGSLPTAYLVVKWKTRQDIRRMGSGNVGALNSYEVTHSKLVGLTVLAVDLTKGLVSVLLSRFLFGDSFLLLGCAALGVVVGHNYPIWLRFKGGRGLAPAAGAALVLSWMFVVIWSLVWAITYLLTKNIHKGNILAIIMTPLIATLLSGSMVEWGILQRDDSSLFILFAFLLCSLLFLRHLQPLKEILAKSS